jgi:chorismate-pyruvate lyase
MSPEAHFSYLATIKPKERSVQERLEHFSDLPPFLRSLLVADGTVTLLLQAYFDESIEVQMLEQRGTEVSSDLAFLGLKLQDTAYYRRVMLTGQASHRTYAEALSLLNPARIHPDLFGQLIDERVGMGEVLRNSARGSFREVLDISRVSDSEVKRTYAVFVEQHPAILITECFQISAFR